MIDLRLGDCRLIAPTLAGIDAVVSDPPYGIRERTRRHANGRSNAALSIDFPWIDGDDAPFDPSPWLRYPTVVLFGANHYASRLPDSHCWLIWDKRDGGTPDDNADCEMAWTNLKRPARLFHHKWRGMIKASERDQKRVHPTQKPVALMRWCIERLKLRPGATILDPYMGSGSTGVAAVELGFNFVGIECHEPYFRVARRRIDAARAACPLFSPEPR